MSVSTPKQVQPETADDELARLEQEVARRKQAQLEAQQRAAEEAATRAAAPETEEEELARLEKNLEAKRTQAKIEAMKRELQALETGNNP